MSLHGTSRPKVEGVRVIEYGPRAVLAEYASLDDVMAAAAHVRDAVAAGSLAGVVDVVPAARTVLVHHTGGVDRSALDAVLADMTPVARGDVPLVEIPVRYDGDDLLAVAVASGLTPSEVIDVHAGGEYTAAFCGFVPGFAYLVGLDARLHLPRRATPRTRVPAGSIAVAFEYTAVYPVSTPGGWHLLGTTELVMWDDDRDPPASIAPGARVRFVPM